jgi:hypothetical protein
VKTNSKTRKKLTDCNGIHHKSDLRDTPSHHERAYRKVLFECRAENDEAADVQRNCDIACPVVVITVILSSRQGRNVPQTIFGLENALIMPGSNVHDGIIQVMADELAYKYGDLCNADKPSCISCFTAARTIGVPYAPAMAYWENPYPSGGGDPRKTALVT